MWVIYQFKYEICTCNTIYDYLIKTEIKLIINNVFILFFSD